MCLFCAVSILLVQLLSSRLAGGHASILNMTLCVNADGFIEQGSNGLKRVQTGSNGKRKSTKTSILFTASRFPLAIVRLLNGRLLQRLRRRRQFRLHFGRRFRLSYAQTCFQLKPGQKHSNKSASIKSMRWHDNSCILVTGY